MNGNLDNLEQRLRGIDAGALRLRPAEATDPWGVDFFAGERVPSDVLRLRWHLEESFEEEHP